MRNVVAFVLLFAPAASAQEVVLDGGRHHLGDDTVQGFADPAAEGLAWSARASDLPALGEGLAWALVLRAHNVVSANTNDFEEGSYHDEVSVDGRAVATINEYAEEEEADWHEVWVPLAGVELEGREIGISAGRAAQGRNHDDFEIESVRLEAVRRVEVSVTEEGGGTIGAKLVVSGPGVPRLGPDFRASGAGRAVFTPDGRAALWLPASGTFRITASHGPEYTVAVAEVPPSEVALTLRRAVETPGMVAADFHLHADPSGDSRVPLPDRIASYLAEGLEFVVATDHNRATDYGPTIRDLGAQERIRSAVGDEITTHRPGLGHFNAFPVREAIDAGGLNARTLVERLDQASTPGRRVLQINHPRSGDIGFFNLMRFDPRTATSPDPNFHFDFDAIEVYNGGDQPLLMPAVLVDWFAILRAGHRITATGNSDSHTVVMEDAGWPRNLVIVGHEGLPTEEEVVAAVRSHRVVVTAGPVVEMFDEEGGSAVGEEIATPDPVVLRIRVQAAPWVRVRRVRLVGPEGDVQAWDVPESEERVRFEEEVTVRPEGSAWYVALVEGDGYGADVITHTRVRPWAFTNPVWITR